MLFMRILLMRSSTVGSLVPTYATFGCISLYSNSFLCRLSELSELQRWLLLVYLHREWVQVLHHPLYWMFFRQMEPLLPLR